MNTRFHDFLKQQTDPVWKVNDADPDHVKYESPAGTASVNFYDNDIVEISIDDKNGENKYWLHFQLNDLDHAKQLVKEMLDAFRQMSAKDTVKILLSCTEGLTTSFLAGLLNQEAKSRHMDWSFDAVPYTEVYEKADGYDAILLAPQIGYLHKKMAGALPDKPVLLLPTALFASNDRNGTLDFVKTELDKFHHDHHKEQADFLLPDKFAGTIMVLGVVFDRNEVKIHYRLYQDGHIVLDRTHVKRSMDYHDIMDVVQVVLAQYPSLQEIVLCVPGIVKDASTLEPIGRHHAFSGIPHAHGVYFLAEYMESRFGLKAFLINNANAFLLGYAKAHPEQKNVLYHSQPDLAKRGGEAYLVDGRLLDRPSGLNGEIPLVLDRLQYSNSPDILCRTPEGMLEIVSQSLLFPIVVLAPDLVLVRSTMTPDMKELKKKVSAYLPARYLPEFEYVKDNREYVMTGGLLAALHAKKEA